MEEPVIFRDYIARALFTLSERGLVGEWSELQDGPSTLVTCCSNCHDRMVNGDWKERDFFYLQRTQDTVECVGRSLNAMLMKMRVYSCSRARGRW
jgi:cytochrome c553